MKIKLIIFSFLALIGIGGATIGGTAIVNNQPENVVMNSITDAYNDFFERDEIKPVYNMLYGGSFEFNSDVSDRGDDIKIAGKLYFDESEIMLENFIYEYDDGYFNFNVNGNIYVSEEMIYIQEDTFFSEGFGIVYNELVDEVSNSILAPGSQTDYELNDSSLNKQEIFSQTFG